MADVMQIIEQRKGRWRDFYDMSAPHRHLFLIRYSEQSLHAPLPVPENRQARIDYALAQYEQDLARAEWLDDDTVPYMYGMTGTEVFAEALGCDVHFYPTNDQNPVARPLITKASEVAAIKAPELSSSTLVRYFDMADELRSRFPDAPLQLIDIQSPMDIAALVWEKTSFYMAIVDAPEAVKELAEKCERLLMAYFDEWFARYGDGFIAHYPDYYMPFGLTLSEDEIGSVNTEMFEEFFLPTLTDLAERYGRIGVHCCANARHQWAGFLKIPNLCLLNLVIYDDEVLTEAYSFFGPHTGQMHDGASWSTPDEWLENLPGDCRAVIALSAESREQALEYSAQFRQACV